MNSDLVERLRIWAAGVERRGEMSLSLAIHEAAMEIERLRKDRDELRREICEEQGYTIGAAHLEAERRGWDCYKENT